MRKLPQYSFNEGFYIWFDTNCKEEFYSTPIYMYKTDFNDDLGNYKRKIVQEKNFYKKKPSKKDSAPKHPATILFPFVEQFGRLLVNLLNADFSDFNNAYNTFFYLYGFELLKEYIPDKELMNTYSNEEELLKIMKRVYEDSYGYLTDMQYNFRKCVDFIYNLSGNKELSFCEIIEDEKQNVEREVYDIELKEQIHCALNYLKEKEKNVIVLRFGLEDKERKTLEEIGNSFGVTKECIRQIEKRALNKMALRLNFALG